MHGPTNVKFINKNWLIEIVTFTVDTPSYSVSQETYYAKPRRTDGQNTGQHDFTSTTSLWTYSRHLSIAVYSKYKHVRFLSPLQFRSSSNAAGRLLTSQCDLPTSYRC